MTSTAACLGNFGPAFGAAVPFGSYAGFGSLSTAVLTTLTWLGRAEIMPVAALLACVFWCV
ncbi:MAG: hypothetical protein M3319_06770 [Actinomycetota bacterium]|nr:hypothetical protein [Actinomycetota bacterium]MDQ3900149.1 hypothetical protein [Actinomycetota bacterium]